MMKDAGINHKKAASLKQVRPPSLLSAVRAVATCAQLRDTLSSLTAVGTPQALTSMGSLPPSLSNSTSSMSIGMQYSASSIGSVRSVVSNPRNRCLFHALFIYKYYYQSYLAFCSKLHVCTTSTTLSSLCGRFLCSPASPTPLLVQSSVTEGDGQNPPSRTK